MDKSKFKIIEVKFTIVNGYTPAKAILVRKTRTWKIEEEGSQTTPFRRSADGVGRPKNKAVTR